MGSFIARYHELTKYDPRSIDRLGEVRWHEQPLPFKEVEGKEILDIKPHLPFLRASVPEEWHTNGLEPGGEFNLDTIARISWFSAGINAMVQGTDPPLYLRATPSAGGLYPIELYWAVFDVPGIDPGLYLFHPVQMGLVPVWRGDFRADLRTIFGNHPDLETVPAMALLTGLFGRGAWRYKERAYRRMLLDAGHLAGNICMTAVAEGLDAHPISAFLDEPLGELLFLDADEEVPLLGIPVGHDLDPSSPRAAESPSIPPEKARVPEGMAFQVHAHRLASLSEPGFAWIPRSGGSPEEKPPLAIDLESQLPDTPGDLHERMSSRRSPRMHPGGTIPGSTFRQIVRWAFDGLTALNGSNIDSRDLTTWIVIHDVGGMTPGVWKLDPSGRFMSLIRPGFLRDESATACLGQHLAHDAAAVFFHTGALDHAVARAGERVYRSMCIDCGQIGQRLAIAAHTCALGTSGIGGYFDEEANKLLDLPPSEAILYISTLGRC